MTVAEYQVPWWNLIIKVRASISQDMILVFHNRVFSDRQFWLQNMSLGAVCVVF